jgi:NADH-quinone oxidoreductase subunit L
MEKAHHVPAWVPILPFLVGLAGISLAWFFYIANPAMPNILASKFKPVYRFLLNKWYFDELYDFLFVRPAKKLGHYLWKFWDEKIIDGLGPNGAALLTHIISGRTSSLQTGFLYHYAFAMLLGFLIIVSWVVLG